MVTAQVFFLATEPYLRCLVLELAENQRFSAKFRFGYGNSPVAVRICIRGRAEQLPDVSEFARGPHSGVFVRPAVAFQPVIALPKGFHLIPYAGLSTMFIAAGEYWEDTRFRRNDIETPSSSLYDDTDTPSRCRAVQRPRREAASRPPRSRRS